MPCNRKTRMRAGLLIATVVHCATPYGGPNRIRFLGSSVVESQRHRVSASDAPLSYGWQCCAVAGRSQSGSLLTFRGLTGARGWP